MATADADDTQGQAGGDDAAKQAAAEAPKPTAAERRAAAAQASQRVDRYTRERLLGADGERITGQPHAVIAGALHDDDREEFTAAEINRKIEAFLAHEDTTGQEE